MSTDNKVVTGWLAVVCLTIFMMIVVGGVTRLTHSGLSMVDWKPIMGFMPPIGEAEWQDTFEAYKQYPEYKQVNKGMDLSEFKGIFYWEYGHRVLGRSIGIIFFLPFMVLLLMGKIERRLVPKMIVALVLGGMQGLMGWYMVMSGLVDMPRVSHYRLAAHLVLALIILSYLYWIILDLRRTSKVNVSSGFKLLCTTILGVTLLQITYGAFTAGLRAGLGFNTYPLMDGEIMASAATMMAPFWLNLFENGAMVQFLHRWIGALLLLLVVVLLGLSIVGNSPRQLKVACGSLVAITLVQFLLGVFTLLNYVPITLASAHQAVACLVLLVSIFLVYIVQDRRNES
jgi:cytochrome c oxidase assembly protein subunit 15